MKKTRTNDPKDDLDVTPMMKTPVKLAPDRKRKLPTRIESSEDTLVDEDSDTQ